MNLLPIATTAPDQGGVREPRERLKELARAMFALPTEAVNAGDLVRLDIEAMTTHYFAPVACDGPTHIYVRVMHIPKGHAVVGKIHLTHNHFIMASGDLLIVGGDTPERITGFNVMLSRPGMQRAVYALEDTVVLNVHATQGEDLALIEPTVVVETQEEFEMIESAKQGLIA